jgi:uncharacterized protein YbbC (DUF1343 family)
MASLHIFKFIALFLLCFNLCSSPIISQKTELIESTSVISGSSQLSQYLTEIQNKKIGIVVNQSSVIHNTHLLDTLVNLGIDVNCIFTPEHGFRGSEEAGVLIEDHFDSKTGLPIISLYGKKRKAEPADLQGIEVILFDLQDVGVRFYTYISTLTYMMEACAENNIKIIVLDRPNPNGYYIDGPLLDSAFASFVGMHPVPIVYGMTIGEYALMVNGEKWLANKAKCDLRVIPLQNYNRNNIYRLEFPPSPNLRSWEAVYLYPSLCLFEGTIVSIGRGTEFPFEVYGHPDYPEGSFSFTPKGNKVLLDEQVCHGQYLVDYAGKYAGNPKQIKLNWIIDCYQKLASEQTYFNSYFDKLAGNDQLRKDIESGKPIPEIRKSWESGLDNYKKIRIKYLLYPDFIEEK